MAFRVERSIHIDRSVEDVFALVSDPRNDPLWCRRVLTCEQLEGDGPRPGARYLARHRPVRLRRPMELDVRIEEIEAPHRVVLRERDADGRFDVVYELVAERGGTRITQRDEVELTGVPKLLHPIGRFNIGRHLDEQFAALKRLLEERAPSAP